jgi:hypothetical protein
MPTIPIVNAGLKYVTGLRLSWTSNTVMSVASGQARNSSNVNDITLSAAQTITTTVSGAGGVDTGTIANSTFYGVYVVGDSTGYEATTAVISADLTTPLLPAGYDMYRRIGYVKTNGSAQFLEFRQDGLDASRWMWYDVAIATNITAGASATFAAVDASAGLPGLTAFASEVNILALFTPTAANNTLELRPGSSSATAGYTRASGDVAAVVVTTNMVVPYDVTTGIDYKVTGSAVALSVAAYLDLLA